MSYDKLNAKMMEMKEEIIGSVRDAISIYSVKGEAEEGARYG